MELEPINIIRESTRNLLKLSRRMHKDQENDSRRCLQEIRITSKDIAAIANKLKTKSSNSVADLQRLKNGLMNDTKNIEVFLNVHGALRGLVRELTGHNVNKQLAAAGCCCNLARGDSRACATVAKAAGSYLVAALDNLTVELAVTCAWALGNLAGSGSPVTSILTAQGALAKLAELQSDEDLQEVALYALLHFGSQLKNDLKTEHLQKMLQTISTLDLTMTSTHLLFTLSCHDSFLENMSPELLEKLLKDLPSAIESHKTCKQTSVVCCKLVYILRVLANTNNMYTVIHNYLLINNLYGRLNSVLSLNNTCVNNTVCWLLGNLLNYCGDDELFLKVLK